MYVAVSSQTLGTADDDSIKALSCRAQDILSFLWCGLEDAVIDAAVMKSRGTKSLNLFNPLLLSFSGFSFTLHTKVHHYQLSASD